MLYMSRQEEILCLQKALEKADPSSPSASLLRRQLLKARLQCLKTEAAIARLPSPRLRMILSARYLEGLSWREMAGRFSLSESRLYGLHRKALALLEDADCPQPPP